MKSRSRVEHGCSEHSLFFGLIIEAWHFLSFGTSEHLGRSFRHTLDIYIARTSFLFISHLHSPGDKKWHPLWVSFLSESGLPTIYPRQQFVAVISLFKQRYDDFSPNSAGVVVRFDNTHGYLAKVQPSQPRHFSHVLFHLGEDAFPVDHLPRLFTKAFSSVA